MKPIKVMCPICGEKMIVRNYGVERDIQRYVGGELAVLGHTINFVDYECSCGNKMSYKGIKDCWRKCKCKNSVEFQEHYPYHEKSCECESCNFRRGHPDEKSS